MKSIIVPDMQPYEPEEKIVTLESQSTTKQIIP